MRLIILILLLLAAETKASWFGSSDERTRRIETEQRLVEQRNQTQKWQLIAIALGAGGFVVGTILGSRTRRHGSTE